MKRGGRRVDTFSGSFLCGDYVLRGIPLSNSYKNVAIVVYPRKKRNKDEM